MWAAFYLKDKTFTRFEPYIMHYLKKEAVTLYDKIVTDVINIIKYYLALLLQSFGDLNKLRIAKLRLLKLIQTASVLEYLIKFT
jgi:hypothetical protein